MITTNLNISRIRFIILFIFGFNTFQLFGQGAFGNCYTSKYKIKINAAKQIDTCAKEIKVTVSYSGTPSYIYWNDGYFGGTRTINKSGDYQVIAYDSAFCMDTSNHVFIRLNDNYINIYSASGKAGPDISVCNGQSEYLRCYSTSKFKWNTGDTSDLIMVSKSGKYFAVTKSPNGCLDTSIVFNVNVLNFNAVKISALGDTSLCFGDSVQLQAKNTSGKFVWYPNYEYTKKITAKTSGTYYVYSVDSASGCYGYSNKIDIQFITPPTEKLCMVTVDSATKRNKLIWNKTSGARIVSYNIYKESNFVGEFELLGSQSYSAAGEFIDTSSNPKQRPFTYYIAAVDSCGNESQESKSYAHTTLHLTASLGVSGENNLNWSDYLGIYPINTYTIYRSNDGGTFKAIGSVSSSVHSFSDLTPPKGSNRYYIGIKGNTDCMGTQTFINSNMVAFGIMKNAEIKFTNIRIFPNPVNNILNVENIPVNGKISLTDIQGKVIKTITVDKETHFQIDLSELDSGLYLISVNNSCAVKFIKR